MVSRREKDAAFSERQRRVICIIFFLGIVIVQIIKKNTLICINNGYKSQTNLEMMGMKKDIKSLCINSIIEVRIAMPDDEGYTCPDCGYSDPAGNQGQNCPNCDEPKEE